MAILYIDEVVSVPVLPGISGRHLQQRAIIETNEPFTLEKLIGFIPEKMGAGRFIYTGENGITANLLLFSPQEKAAVLGSKSSGLDLDVDKTPTKVCQYCPFVIYKNQCFGQKCPLWDIEE